MPRTRIYLYEEEQRFTQWWLWAMLLGFTAVETAVFGWGLYQQIFLGRPFGKQPLSDAGLLAVALLVFAAMLGVLWLFRAMRLTVRLDEERLEVHFFPLRRRVIPLADIVSAGARTYSPLGDYGGWGIRYGGKEKGWAYNVSGDRGVFLELAGGGRLLVGSQNADRFAAALRNAMENKKN
jgi:hypothetical protein